MAKVMTQNQRNGVACFHSGLLNLAIFAIGSQDQSDQMERLLAS